MRSVCILLFFFGSHFAFCQEGNAEQLLVQAENTLYSNPQEAIRIAEYVSNKAENNNQLLQAAYILVRSYYIKGNYNEALKIGLKFSNEEFKSNNSTQLKLDVLLSKLLKELELNELAKKYMNKAIQLSQNTSNQTLVFWLDAKILQYNIESNTEETDSQTFARLYIAKNSFEKTTDSLHTFQIGNINLDIAALHIREYQLDSVPYYLEAAYFKSKKENPGNYLEMESLQQYGHVLFLKKQHPAAIDSLKAAFRIAEKFTNIAEQISISEAIADNYLALDDLINFNSQNEKTQLLNNSQTDIENEAVNTAFNFISDNELKQLRMSEASFRWNALFLGAVLLFVLLLWGFLAFRYRIKTKQYQNFIAYFEKEQKPKPSPPLKEKAIKSSVVPQEMEEKLLEKLNNFENTTDFTKQETSLSRLALQFETNTKYLSEVVNSHKQKNFNSYINELRVNYIIDKLKRDPAYLQYKISYLAEDSGFASHSLFATVFKSVTGIPPTTFITIIKDKKEASGKNRTKNES